jgi:hypothetical protein
VGPGQSSPGKKGAGKGKQLTFVSDAFLEKKKKLLQGLTEKMNKKKEVDERRKKLLQSLTDQLKMVMGKIADSKTTEKQREQLQTILASIKTKMTALTPKPVPKPEPPRPLPPPSRALPSAAHQAHRRGSQRTFVELRLSSLPAELRGPEAEVRLGQALGQSVQAVHSWSKDRTSCVVRFLERKHADAAMQAQKVWGFVAALVKGTPAQSTARASREAAPPSVAPRPNEEPDAIRLDSPSMETEDMETDIEEDDVPNTAGGSGGAAVDLTA